MANQAFVNLPEINMCKSCGHCANAWRQSNTFSRCFLPLGYQPPPEFNHWASWKYTLKMQWYQGQHGPNAAALTDLEDYVITMGELMAQALRFYQHTKLDASSVFTFGPRKGTKSKFMSPVSQIDFTNMLDQHAQNIGLMSGSLEYNEVILEAEDWHGQMIERLDFFLSPTTFWSGTRRVRNILVCSSFAPRDMSEFTNRDQDAANGKFAP